MRALTTSLDIVKFYVVWRVLKGFKRVCVCARPFDVRESGRFEAGTCAVIWLVDAWGGCDRVQSDSSQMNRSWIKEIGRKWDVRCLLDGQCGASCRSFQRRVLANQDGSYGGQRSRLRLRLMKRRKAIEYAATRTTGLTSVALRGWCREGETDGLGENDNGQSTKSVCVCVPERVTNALNQTGQDLDYEAHGWICLGALVALVLRLSPARKAPLCPRHFRHPTRERVTLLPSLFLTHTHTRDAWTLLGPFFSASCFYWVRFLVFFLFFIFLLQVYSKLVCASTL